MWIFYYSLIICSFVTLEFDNIDFFCCCNVLTANCLESVKSFSQRICIYLCKYINREYLVWHGLTQKDNKVFQLSYLIVLVVWYKT